MNHVHQDGHALIKLSRQVELAPDKNLSKVKTKINPKPAPPHGIQRQDTDYDVKPEIPTPKPKKTPKRASSDTAGRWDKHYAATPDTGIFPHATQMGESENQTNYDAKKAQTHFLRHSADEFPQP